MGTTQNEIVCKNMTCVCLGPNVSYLVDIVIFPSETKKMAQEVCQSVSK
jgi:hypothetical protein